MSGSISFRSKPINIINAAYILPHKKPKSLGDDMNTYIENPNRKDSLVPLGPIVSVSSHSTSPQYKPSEKQLELSLFNTNKEEFIFTFEE